MFFVATSAHKRRAKMDRIYVMQLVRSFQVGEITRRTFLSRATAALGSVAAANLLLAACQPVRPETPPVLEAGSATPQAAAEAPAGLITENVEYPDDEDETLTGYLARPESGEAAPAVILIQEWWGLNQHILDVTNRFAAEGFVVLAPDLYKGQVATEPDEARKLVMELDMPEAVNEIQQAIAFLLEQDYVAGDKVGIVGFCMGGGLALQTARAEADRLGAAVAFYGSPLTPAEAAEVNAPILGLYGGKDQGIPVDAVRSMEEALDAAGIDNEIYVYEDAQHAFFNDTRASSYDAEASADAWEKTLAWFRQHLAA
jgi:carboxymethylenebutenolidase